MARPKKVQRSPRSDGRYEYKAVVGKDVIGKPIRKSFYSYVSYEDAKKQSETYRIEKTASRMAGVAFRPGSVLFKKWALEWIETYKKPEVTEETFRSTYDIPVSKHLIPYFGEMALSDILPVNVQAFVTKMKGYSQSEMDKFKICLNGMFEAAIDNDLCVKNPARRIRFKSSAKKKIKQIYSDEEIKKIKALAEDKMPSVVFLLETGLRRGELLGLRWDDINFIDGEYSVRRSVSEIKGGKKLNPPKWGSYRTNPLSSEAAKALQRLPHTSEYVFPNKYGDYQMPSVWSRSLSRFMGSLDGMKKLTAHELRHTYGTWLYRKGVSIFDIQRIMGHKSIQVTTEIYVHKDVKVLKRGLKKANIA